LGSSTATRRAVRWLLRGAPKAWEVGAFVAFWVELEESLAPIEGSCDKRNAMTNRIACYWCYMTKDVSTPSFLLLRGRITSWARESGDPFYTFTGFLVLHIVQNLCNRTGSGSEILSFDRGVSEIARGVSTRCAVYLILIAFSRHLPRPDSIRCGIVPRINTGQSLIFRSLHCRSTP